MPLVTILPLEGNNVKEVREVLTRPKPGLELRYGRFLRSKSIYNDCNEGLVKKLVVMKLVA